MPKQVCRNRPVCNTLVVCGECPYCPDCVRAGALKDKRPTAHQRGYTSKWQKASAAYLVTHPIAVDIFNTHGGRRLPAVIVDHIIPHRGDMKLFWDSTNWQGVTKADHDRKTALQDGGFGRRRVMTDR